MISAEQLLIDPQAVRESARRGELARWAADATEDERRRLTGAVYEIALPLVFNGLTRRLEQQRGHAACAASLRGMTDDCFDRFEDGAARWRPGLRWSLRRRWRGVAGDDLDALFLGDCLDELLQRIRHVLRIPLPDSRA